MWLKKRLDTRMEHGVTDLLSTMWPLDNKTLYFISAVRRFRSYAVSSEMIIIVQ